MAYAIGRPVGGAVVRNRLRRRMRAIVAERTGTLPTGAYLVRSAPEGPNLQFRELKDAMCTALEQAVAASGRPTGGIR